MNELMNEIAKKIDNLDANVKNFLESVSGQKLPFSFNEQVNAYETNQAHYLRFLKEDNNRQASKFANNMAIHAQAFKNSLKVHNLSEELQLQIEEIFKLANTLRNEIDNKTEIFEYSTSEEKSDQNVLPRRDSEKDNLISRDLIRKIELIKDDHEKHDQRHQKLLFNNLKRIEEIESKSQKMQSLVEEKLNATNAVYDETIARLEEKEKNINKLLGIISGKKVAGKYEESAAEEKVLADWLRYASIFCMALIVLVVGYSFWETTTADFKWESSIFRVVLAFFLSVPAAYLARESAKHREQQYNHLQTSLDLNAIDPYVDSLPPEQRNKIKADIAGRIFAAKNISGPTQESYPINTHELLMELLKKVDFIDKNKSASKVEKG